MFRLDETGVSLISGGGRKYENRRRVNLSMSSSRQPLIMGTPFLNPPPKKGVFGRRYDFLDLFHQFLRYEKNNIGEASLDLTKLLVVLSASRSTISAENRILKF